MRSTPGNGKQSRILVGNFHYAQHREREIRVGYNRRALISSEVRVGITIVLGKRVVPRLRESRLLTPSGRGARVHAA